VGRYLEHSRVYRFGEPGEGDYFISSADMMPRNLDRRVEIAVPVVHTGLRTRLDEILDLSLADDTLAWTFDGETWARVPTSRGINAQVALQEGATRRNRGLG
jgi:polyphosphate kinase